MKLSNESPNYDYVTTLAPMKTVEDIDGDNFINARKRPFHDTDQVCKNIGDSNTGLSDLMVRKSPLMLVAIIFHLDEIHFE